MKKRITIEIDENDPLYQLLIKYTKENYTTLTGAIKLSLQKFLNEDQEKL